MKNKTTAGLFALLLGGLGVHKFYLGQSGMGVLYLLFFWTGIPAIVALIEGVMYLTMSDEDFNLKYNSTQVILQQISQQAASNQNPAQPQPIIAPIPPSAAPKTVAVPSGGFPMALFGLSGSYMGKAIPVPPEGLILGRDSVSCNLVIGAEGISRRHARIAKTPSGGGWVVEDLNSTNGTFIFASNGWARVQGQQTVSTGSRIRLGTDGPEFEVRPN